MPVERRVIDQAKCGEGRGPVAAALILPLRDEFHLAATVLARLVLKFWWRLESCDESTTPFVNSSPDRFPHVSMPARQPCLLLPLRDVCKITKHPPEAAGHIDEFEEGAVGFV